MSELEPGEQDAENTQADDKNGTGELTRVSHEVREVDAEGKQAEFLAFMQVRCALASKDDFDRRCII